MRQAGPQVESNGQDAFGVATSEQVLIHLRTRLSDLLDGIDVIELLARASIFYLPKSLDALLEPEGEALQVHIEYLALQILGIMQSGGCSNNAKPSWPLTYEVMEVIQALFVASYQQLFESRFQESEGNQTEMLAARAQAESLGIRVTAYPMHLIRVLEGCFENLDEPCREILGFTADEAIRLNDASARLVQSRVLPLLEESGRRGSEHSKLLKRERRKAKKKERRSLILGSETPSAQKKRVRAGIFESSFDESKSMVTVTPEELAVLADVEMEATQKFLETFSAQPKEYDERHHRYPALSSPISQFPIVRTDAGYLIVNHLQLLEAIRPRMEEAFATTRYWERYQRLRASYLERESADLIAVCLRTPLQWKNLHWRSSSLAGELDALVSCDDVTVRLQCKGGSVSEEARRGAPASMLETLDDLVGDASAQHERLSEALTDVDPSSLGFDKEQSRALKAELQFELITTLDAVTAWATKARYLQGVETHGRPLLAADRPVPWVVSITDLMVVCDLLSGPLLVQYLLFRRRIEEDGTVETHDELDWLGNFLGAGLDLDMVLGAKQETVFVRLGSHTSQIDYWYFSKYAGQSDSEKPSVRVPPHTSKFVQLLETTRPLHWMSGALALLEGQSERKVQTEEAVKAGIRKFNRGEVAWAEAERRPGLGVVMIFDPSESTFWMSARMNSFAEKLSLERQWKFCVCVGYSSSREAVVNLVGTRADYRLMDALTQPLRIPES